MGKERFSPAAGEATSDWGRPEWDWITSRSPSGLVTRISSNERRIGELLFENVRGRKTYVALETTVNESWERFLKDAIGDAASIRYYDDRADDAVYWTLSFLEDAADFLVAPVVPSWAGAQALYTIGPHRMAKEV